MRGIEGIDQGRYIRALQPFAQAAARLQELGRDVPVPHRVEPAAQAELIDVLVELHRLQQPDHLAVERGEVGDAGAFQIQPIVAGIEPGIAGAQGLAHAALEMPQALAFILRRLHRTVLQAIEQVLAQGQREEVALLADIGEAPSGDGFRKRQQVLVAVAELAGGRRAKRPSTWPRCSLPLAPVPITARCMSGAISRLTSSTRRVP